MRKDKIRPYYLVKNVVDDNNQKHSILVYGEVVESYPKYMTALTVTEVNQRTGVLKNTPYGNQVKVKETRERRFYMGYAICQEADEFDLNFGIKLAKKRFPRSPLYSNNGQYLNDDMVYAIIKNEVQYIETNLDKYIKTATVESPAQTTTDNTEEDSVLVEMGYGECCYSKPTLMVWVTDTTFNFGSLKKFTDSGFIFDWYVTTTENNHTTFAKITKDETPMMVDAQKAEGEVKEKCHNLLKKRFNLKFVDGNLVPDIE